MSKRAGILSLFIIFSLVATVLYFRNLEKSSATLAPGHVGSTSPLGGHMLTEEEIAYWDKKNNEDRVNYEKYVEQKYGKPIVPGSQFRKRTDGIYLGTEVRYGTLVSSDGTVTTEEPPAKDVSVFVTNDVTNFTDLGFQFGKDSKNVYQAIRSNSLESFRILENIDTQSFAVKSFNELARSSKTYYLIDNNGFITAGGGRVSLSGDLRRQGRCLISDGERPYNSSMQEDSFGQYYLENITTNDVDIKTHFDIESPYPHLGLISDKNFVYLDCGASSKISAHGFSLFNSFYAKNSNGVFFISQYSNPSKRKFEEIPEADAKTFQIVPYQDGYTDKGGAYTDQELGETHVAKDKKNVYVDKDIVKDLDPSRCVYANSCQAFQKAIEGYDY